MSKTCATMSNHVQDMSKPDKTSVHLINFLITQPIGSPSPLDIPIPIPVRNTPSSSDFLVFFRPCIPYFHWRRKNKDNGGQPGYPTNDGPFQRAKRRVPRFYPSSSSPTSSPSPSSSLPSSLTQKPFYSLRLDHSPF